MPWDFRAVHLPLFSAIVRAFSKWELPLWDPYTYGGMPLYANIQSALFYPPTIIAALVGTFLDEASLPRFLAFTVVAHIVFAAICTFALLKKLGVQPSSAFLGATMFQLGCFFASQAQHMGAIEGASWLPLAWLCVLHLKDNFRWRWMAGLALTLAMPILAGLPQIAVSVTASAICLALLLNRKLALSVILAAAWAVLIAAIQYIPTYELTMNSVAKYRTEWLKGGGGIHTEALWSLVSPNYWGVFDLSTFKGPGELTFLYLYIGIIGLILTVAGMVYKPDRRAVVFTFMTIGSAIWMMGEWTPVGRLILAAIPQTIRIGIHPEFSLCVFSLSAAVVAGLAAERFLINRVPIAALIAAELITVSSGRPMNTMNLAKEPGITHEAIDGSKELLARLRQLTSSGTRFDVATDVHFNWLSTAALTQLPTAGGCDPLAPERMIEVRRTFSPGPHWGTCFAVADPASPVLGLINSRYLVSRAEVSSPFHKQIEEINGYRIYERSETKPRAYFAKSIQQSSGLVESAKLLASARDTAIVEGNPPTDVSIGEVTSALETRNASAGFLVVNEAFYPGWEATVDGNPVTIYPTNVAFRGIHVPAGNHKIEMRFRPKILAYSAGFTALGLFLVLIAYKRKD